MNSQEAIVIVGATSHIAQHVTSIWAQESNAAIFLIARDISKLHPISSNLKILNPNSQIICKQLLFSDIKTANDLITQIADSHTISKVLIAFGTLPDQSICQKDFELAQNSLIINGVLPIIFCEIFISKMKDVKSASLSIIGSVAGDRGRKSNYFYGAAKGMIDTYVQGARHRLSKSALHLCIIKPGPTESPMTEGMDNGLQLAKPASVAMDIVKGIKDRKAIIYTPTKWKLIMMIIRNLPEFIFKKLNI